MVDQFYKSVILYVHAASYVAQLLEDSHFGGDPSPFTENPDKVVAVWHVYHPMYSNNIQAFLNKVKLHSVLLVSFCQHCCLVFDNSNFFRKFY